MNQAYGKKDTLDACTVFRALSDAEWLEMLERSVTEETIQGIRFPRFPPEALQSQFVGSANSLALREARYFYEELKASAEFVGLPVQEDSKVLDFGCGWGRYLRFFWKDVRASGLFGVDVDPDILEVCRQTGVPGTLSQINPTDRLRFDDAFFSHILAYSVFTHLPANIHLHWMEEIARVLRPNGVFALTLEPRRFIDFVGEQAKNASASPWHQAMAQYSSSVPEFIRAFDEGSLVYLPTGGGNHRHSDVYGDAVVPISFIEKNWTKKFDILDYIDDPSRYWQAVLVVRRRAD